MAESDATEKFSTLSTNCFATIRPLAWVVE